MANRVFATKPGEKLLLTVEEASDLLSVGRTKLYELVGQGIIPGVKIGRCTRVRLRDLEAYVDQMAEAAEAGGGVWGR